MTLVQHVLPYGDYATTFEHPSISVDTKRNIQEAISNICGSKREHERFKRECTKAKENGCQLIALIENADGVKSLENLEKWSNPDCVFRKKAVHGNRLSKAMRTMSERYGVKFLFCHPAETASTIIRILEEERWRQKI